VPPPVPDTTRNALSLLAVSCVQPVGGADWKKIIFVPATKYTVLFSWVCVSVTLDDTLGNLLATMFSPAWSSVPTSTHAEFAPLRIINLVVDVSAQSI
jgi:hypothetical protein